MPDTMPPPKETVRSVERPTAAHIGTVRHYLEREFPGQHPRTWWEENTQAQIFEIAHGAGRYRIVVDLAFLQECADCGGALHDKDLADSIRESPLPGRCFLVRWYEGGMHIRSKPL